MALQKLQSCNKTRTHSSLYKALGNGIKYLALYKLLLLTHTDTQAKNPTHEPKILPTTQRRKSGVQPLPASKKVRQAIAAFAFDGIFFKGKGKSCNALRVRKKQLVIFFAIARQSLHGSFFCLCLSCAK